MTKQIRHETKPIPQEWLDHYKQWKLDQVYFDRLAEAWERTYGKDKDNDLYDPA